MARKTAPALTPAPNEQPAESLGIEPRIRDMAGLKKAALWFAFLRSRLDLVSSNLKSDTAAAKAVADAAAVITVDNVKTTLGEYLGRLETAMKVFTRDHAEEIFEDGKRSAELPHATVSMAFTPEKVVLEKDEQNAVDNLVELFRIKTKYADLQAALNKTPGLKLVLQLDKDGLKRSVKTGLLSAKALADRGITIEKTEEVRISV